MKNKSVYFYVKRIVLVSAMFTMIAKSQKTTLEKDIKTVYKATKTVGKGVARVSYEVGKGLGEVIWGPSKRGYDLAMAIALLGRMTVADLMKSIWQKARGVNRRKIMWLFESMLKQVKGMDREQLIATLDKPYTSFKSFMSRAGVFGLKAGITVSVPLVPAIVIFAPQLFVAWVFLAREFLYEMDATIMMKRTRLYLRDLTNQLQKYIVRLEEHNKSYPKPSDVSIRFVEAPFASESGRPAIRYHKFLDELNARNAKVKVLWKQYEATKYDNPLREEMALRQIRDQVKIAPLVSKDAPLQKILRYNSKLERKVIKVPDKSSSTMPYGLRPF